MAMRKTTAQPHAESYPNALQQQLDGYIADLRARKQAPATIRKRTDNVKRLLDHLADRHVCRLQDVDLDVLTSFRLALIDHGYAPNTIYSCLVTVRCFFAFLTDHGVLFENPAAAMPIAKPPKTLALVLDQDQIRRLLNQPDLTTPAGQRDRAVLELLYATGIRAGECVGLTIFDADLDKQTVKVRGKGAKDRLLPLGRHAADHLRHYLATARPRLIRDNDPPDKLFLGCRRARPLQVTDLRLIIKRHAPAADLPYQTDTHTIRRTCATHMLRGGAHPVAVARMLGHADLTSLAHYLKTTITDLKQTHAKTKPGQ